MAWALTVYGADTEIQHPNSYCESLSEGLQVCSIARYPNIQSKLPDASLFLKLLIIIFFFIVIDFLFFWFCCGTAAIISDSATPAAQSGD